MNTFIVHKMKNKNSGVTFIELLLYISLSAIILMVSAVFLSLLLRSRVKNQTMAEVGQQGIQMMQLITQEIRNADSINSPSTGSVGTTLSLATSGGTRTFTFSGGNLQMQEGGGTQIPLSSSRVTLSNATFHNLSRAGTPGIVRIQFTLTHINPNGQNEYTFSRDFTTSSALRHP